MKKINIKSSLLSLLLIGSLTTSAQQETQNSFYMFNASLLNPAYAGSRDALSLVADGRQQWTGWGNGRPQTNCFTLHTPLMIESIGIGLNVLNDKIGATQRNSVFADLSYRIRLNKNNDRLAFGLRGGVDILNKNYTNLQVNDNTDPLANQNFTSALFNTGAGVYLYGKRYFVGVTAPKVIPNKLSSINGFSSKEAVHIYFIAGYVYKINSLWDLKPGMSVRYTANAPLSIDGNLSVLFNQKIWFGVMYRHGSAAGANIMYNFTPAIRVGYAYDYSITNMNKYNNGTHEVLIGFDLIKKQQAARSPRYF